MTSNEQSTYIRSKMKNKIYESRCEEVEDDTADTCNEAMARSANINGYQARYHILS